MAGNWAFYSDDGLTALAAGGAAVATDGESADRFVVFGSPDLGTTLQAASDPGVDAIEVSVVDASGGGIAATAIKLALSYSGLDAAIAGAPLVIGTTLSGGAANSVRVYVRTLRGSLTEGLYSDLSLTTNAYIEA